MVSRGSSIHGSLLRRRPLPRDRHADRNDSRGANRVRCVLSRSTAGEGEPWPSGSSARSDARSTAWSALTRGSSDIDAYPERDSTAGQLLVGANPEGARPLSRGRPRPSPGLAGHRTRRPRCDPRHHPAHRRRQPGGPAAAVGGRASALRARKCACANLDIVLRTGCRPRVVLDVLGGRLGVRLGGERLTA